MRKRVSLASILVLSLLVMLQGLQVLDANPVLWLSTPNREKPALNLQSPTNQTTYKTEVPIDFNVTAPESWATYTVRLTWNDYYVGEVQYVAVYLDSKPLINYTTSHIVSYFSGNWKIYPYSDGFDGLSTHYSFNLNKTTSGSHTLNVTVGSFTYADGDPIDDTAIAFQTGSINGEPIYAYKYPNVVSEVVHFTVEQPTPTQNSNAIDSDYLLNQPNLILIAIVIAIMVVALVSLVFFKRHKSKAV